MSFMTKYGSVWSILPQTTGRYFFVAPAATYTLEGQAYEASNNNDGLSPARALRTVAQAVTNATASVGDVIVLLPGAHTVTAAVVINKAGLLITGIPGATRGYAAKHPSGAKRLRTTITTSVAEGIIFTISAPDTEVSYINFLPVAAGGRGISITPTLATANRTYIHDCVFSMQATASTTTYGIHVPANVTADVLDEALLARVVL